MGMMASQITSLVIVYVTVYSGAIKKNQSSASLAFVRGIHRWLVNSLPVQRKMFTFDDVIKEENYFMKDFSLEFLTRTLFIR